jgi:hypothetical protein
VISIGNGLSRVLILCLWKPRTRSALRGGFLLSQTERSSIFSSEQPISFRP